MIRRASKLRKAESSEFQQRQAPRSGDLRMQLQQSWEQELQKTLEQKDPQLPLLKH